MQPESSAAGSSNSASVARTAARCCARKGLEASSTCSSKSASVAACRVSPKQPRSPGESRRMKPTVSTKTASLPLARCPRRECVSSDANSASEARLSSLGRGASLS
eukprot:scaffold9393_cov66-Phaeocystis_antarctica.AAC.5